MNRVDKKDLDNLGISLKNLKIWEFPTNEEIEIGLVLQGKRKEISDKAMEVLNAIKFEQNNILEMINDLLGFDEIVEKLLEMGIRAKFMKWELSSRIIEFLKPLPPLKLTPKLRNLILLINDLILSEIIYKLPDDLDLIDEFLELLPIINVSVQLQIARKLKINIDLSDKLIEILPTLYSYAQDEIAYKLKEGIYKTKEITLLLDNPDLSYKAKIYIEESLF